MAWQNDAACSRRLDLDWFVDEPTLAHIGVCSRCPVIAACLDEGLWRLEPGYDPGIRAGMGPQERGILRRKLRRKGAA